MSVFTGKTIAEALQKGQDRFHQKQSQLKIKIVQKPRKGFFGFGKRMAKLEIVPTHPHHAHTIHKSHSTQHSSTVKSFTIKLKKPLHLNRSFKVKKVTVQHHATSHENHQNAIKKLEKYLGDIIRQLGISATMETKMKSSKQVTINFKTDKEGLLIGKHGLTINALQELSKVYLNRLGLYHLYVELDTADYRQRRMDILGHLAKKTAREAVATGKPVYLDPMPSFERKKIHKTLQDSDHVMTYSAGREPYRAVVVAPK